MRLEEDDCSPLPASELLTASVLENLDFPQSSRSESERVPSRVVSLQLDRGASASALPDIADISRTLSKYDQSEVAKNLAGVGDGSTEGSSVSSGGRRRKRRGGKRAKQTQSLNVLPEGSIEVDPRSFGRYATEELGAYQSGDYFEYYPSWQEPVGIDDSLLPSTWAGFCGELSSHYSSDEVLTPTDLAVSYPAAPAPIRSQHSIARFVSDTPVPTEAEVSEIERLASDFGFSVDPSVASESLKPSSWFHDEQNLDSSPRGAAEPPPKQHRRRKKQSSEQDPASESFDYTTQPADHEREEHDAREEQAADQQDPQKEDSSTSFHEPGYDESSTSQFESEQQFGGPQARSGSLDDSSNASSSQAPRWAAAPPPELLDDEPGPLDRADALTPISADEDDPFSYTTSPFFKSAANWRPGPSSFTGKKPAAEPAPDSPYAPRIFLLIPPPHHTIKGMRMCSAENVRGEAMS